MKRVVINIRASKNISGLVKVSLTSPAGLMKFFLNVEPWILNNAIKHGLSQGLENGCPKLAVVKFFGNNFLREITMYIEMKKFKYILEIDILRI